MNRRVYYIVAIAILIFVFSFGFIAGKNDTKNVLSGTASVSPSLTPSNLSPTIRLNLHRVVKVIDGDTIVTDVNGKDETIRLIGIDTPEIVDPRKPVQCFASEASEKAKTLLSGKSVSLEADPSQGDRDKYHRLLRYVFLEDGTNFNQIMIAQGFAHEYTYNLPYKYQSQFKKAEKEAREKELGLWSPSTCSVNTSSSSLNQNFQPSPTVQIIQQQTGQSGQAVSSDYKPTGIYTCDCSKLCGKIKTCDEAYYQLKNCGCSARDADGDGVPCESLCR